MVEVEPGAVKLRLSVFGVEGFLGSTWKFTSGGPCDFPECAAANEGWLSERLLRPSSRATGCLSVELADSVCCGRWAKAEEALSALDSFDGVVMGCLPRAEVLGVCVGALEYVG